MRTLLLATVLLLVPSLARAQSAQACLPASPSCAPPVRVDREPAAGSYEPRPLSPGQRHELAQLLPQVCRSEDPALVEDHYRAAIILFGANRFREAGAHFQRIVRDHPTHPAARRAAAQYIEILDLLHRREDRPACLVALVDEIDPLASTFCASPSQLRDDPLLCDALGSVRCWAVRRRAERSLEDGRAAEAGRLYRALVDQRPA